MFIVFMCTYSRSGKDLLYPGKISKMYLVPIHTGKRWPELVKFPILHPPRSLLGAQITVAGVDSMPLVGIYWVSILNSILYFGLKIQSRAKQYVSWEQR